MGKNQDPVSGIRYPESGFRDKHPGSATLFKTFMEAQVHMRFIAIFDQKNVNFSGFFANTKKKFLNQ
jgi:hypothetical protein